MIVVGEHDWSDKVSNEDDLRGGGFWSFGIGLAEKLVAVAASGGQNEQTYISFFDEYPEPSTSIKCHCNNRLIGDAVF